MVMEISRKPIEVANSIEQIARAENALYGINHDVSLQLDGYGGYTILAKARPDNGFWDWNRGSGVQALFRVRPDARMGAIVTVEKYDKNDKHTSETQIAEIESGLKRMLIPD